MHNKKYKWYKIADAIDELQFDENSLMQIEVAGKKICVAKTSKSLAACTAKCPHAGGMMAEGFLDKNDSIVCLVHRYTFSLINGRDTTGEGYYLKIYPVQENDSGIFIGIEEGGLFSWLK